MRRVLSAALLAVLLPCAAAFAEPVTYTLTGTFSGTLDALSFNGVAGTITMSGDTANTNSLGAGYYTNTAGVSTVSLAGIGTAVVLSPTFGAIGAGYTAGFFDLDNSFGASMYDPSLSGYDLSTGFTDTAYLEIAQAFLQPYSSELTSLGLLTFTGDNGTSATFTATASSTNPPSTVTPEPSSLLLLGTGLAGMAGMLRRRLAA